MYRVLALTALALVIGPPTAHACVDLGPPKPEEEARARALYEATAGRPAPASARIETASIKLKPATSVPVQPLSGCMRTQ